MAIQTYSIINNSTLTTATVKFITIETTLTEMQHHLDLTGWEEPFNTSYTDFQGDNTLQTVTKTYVSDVRPINRNYAYHSTVNLLVSGGTVSGISSGWAVSGNSFTPGTTVSATSGTQWVILSAAPATLPPVGEVITFTPPAFLLTLNNITGIFNGWAANGAGYSGQTVVNTVTGFANTVEMSGYSSSGSPSGSITFTSAGDNMLRIEPLTSSTFKMNYTRNTAAYGTYTSQVFFHFLQGTAVVKRVDNIMVVSSAPVSNPSNPIWVYESPGGIGNSPPCDDANSVSCTAAGAGGSCFIPTTKIKMADGCEKSICDIKIGDYVLDAYSNKPNKVIGIKSRMYNAGEILFSPTLDVEPFMTEEHPYYDDENNLCSVSDKCFRLAPWLGQTKIIKPNNVITLDYDLPVYNLMLETGETHYANGIKVNNIIKTGGVYVLYYKGYLDYDEYINFVREPKYDNLHPEQKIKFYKGLYILTKYVLHYDNVLSKILGKALSWSIKNRKTIKPYFDSWFQSRFRKLLFGKNI